ncbi:hypothetical protein RRG08_042214 [Elysia crispata]|uniref:Uncharacterized protein n=1 Tax=Elysia crispata TaxID=231223 RepID=A0AAE1EB65_9GAST|nr:hypothetical protein RRG08_042214 [Elysia crispata]
MAYSSNYLSFSSPEDKIVELPRNIARNKSDMQPTGRRVPQSSEVTRRATVTDYYQQAVEKEWENLQVFNLPQAVEIPAAKEKKEIEVKLKLTRKSETTLKYPGDNSTLITGITVFSPTSVVIAYLTRNGSHLELFCPDSGTRHVIFRKENRLTTSVLDTPVQKLIVSNGTTIFLGSGPENSHQVICGSSALAAAIATHILLLDISGTVYRAIEITQIPGLGMCCTTEQTLLICGPNGIYEIDVYTGDLKLKYPEIKSVNSVAAYEEGYFFACDAKKRYLYLIAPDRQEIQQVWSFDKRLRTGDELEYVSAHRKNLVCVSKFGFLITFNDLSYGIERKQIL